MPDNGQKKKRGVSYPPYMADAKEETPNERSAGLKYRERNEEKLRADARSRERNLYKPNRIGKIYTSQDKSDWNLYKVSVWMR
jgi:hypothetical protein